MSDLIDWSDEDGDTGSLFVGYEAMVEYIGGPEYSKGIPADAVAVFESTNRRGTQASAVYISRSQAIQIIRALVAEVNQPHE